MKSFLTDSEEARTREKRWNSVDFKVSFELTQNICIENVLDVSKPLLTSDQESGIKRQSYSRRHNVRALQRGLVWAEIFLTVQITSLVKNDISGRRDEP